MSTANVDAAPVARLSTLDRLLPVWIGAAMGLGLLLGRLIPGLGGAVSAVQVDGISLPIALGLLVMMYPVLAKVRYDRLDSVTRDRKLLLAALSQRGDDLTAYVVEACIACRWHHLLRVLPVATAGRGRRRTVGA